MRAAIDRARRRGTKLAGLIALAASCAAVPAAAQTAAGPHPRAEAQALEILKRAIAFRTVAGPGNQTPQFAAYLKNVLVAGGFAETDVSITRVDDTAYLIARYPGRDHGAKPLLLSGHMDVVEARPSDWQRDPFTPVIENGYIYGRGATDMKFGDAVMIATLIDLKRQSFVPDRDIDLVLSGDEETAMKTTALIAARFPGAALALNADGGGGRLGEDGRPQYFDLEGAEKTYADFELVFTNPGGHSSAPRKVNAIYQLARALERIGAYRFTPQENALTRAFFLAAAKRATPPLAAAMRAFAANPADPKAIAVLSAEPGYVGQIGTTCVATMIAGGHAPNALPQRASANVNCRIFPGVGVARTQAKLVEIVGDPAMKIRTIDTGTIESDASPMRPDVTQAVGRALAIDYAGVPIIPSMAAGASDNMWFRHNGVPSYGISSIFIKDSDDLSHGLNERTPIANLAPSIRYWTSLIADLSR